MGHNNKTVHFVQTVSNLSKCYITFVMQLTKYLTHLCHVMGKLDLSFGFLLLLRGQKSIICCDILSCNIKRNLTDPLKVNESFIYVMAPKIMEAMTLV